MTAATNKLPPLADVFDARAEHYCALYRDKRRTDRSQLDGKALEAEAASEIAKPYDALIHQQEARIAELEAEIAESRRVLDPETPGHRSPDWVPPQTPLGKRAHEFRGAMELGLRSADIGIQAALRREREQSAELAKFRELAREAEKLLCYNDPNFEDLAQRLAAMHKEAADG